MTERRKDYYTIKEYVEELKTAAIERLERHEQKIDQFIEQQDQRHHDYIQLKELIGSYLRDQGKIEKEVFVEIPKKTADIYEKIAETNNKLYRSIYSSGGLLLVISGGIIAVLKYFRIL